MTAHLPGGAQGSPTSPAWSTIAGLLTADLGHVPVPLRRLAQPQVLWLNERAIREDPAFASLGRDPWTYSQHLLHRCAFILTECDESTADAIGYADRYGGAGIGHNGGSGRNVCVNGYLVKGVGRTPLVSARTPESHASGGAYLEECVRETVFSEIVAAEFPHGGVPTLAIIDTGLMQVWQTAEGPKPERRTLLVRPPFLRPAHFERAITFLSGRQLEGAADHGRLLAMFRGAAAALGRDGLRGMFEALWVRWAHQLAYAFVHRLPHGSNTSSNIALDGRLVDFGAMTAVPSWSNAATALMPDPFTSRFSALEQGLRSLSHYFGRHLDATLGDSPEVERRVATTRAQYEQFVCYEVMRLCGVPDDVAAHALQATGAARVWKRVRRCIAHYQQERIDMVVTVQLPQHPWDLHRVWDDRPPAHLVPLQSLLLDTVGSAARSSAQATCLRRCASRPLLYGQPFRELIYNELERHPAVAPATRPAQVAALVERLVVHSRRDKLPAGPVDTSPANRLWKH